MSRQRVLSRTTKTGVRDFCDMGTPLAGPDRSQQATTDRRIGRKSRKFRDKFESMPCPEKQLYNNDLWMAVQGVSSEPVSAEFPVKQGKNREFLRIWPEKRNFLANQFVKSVG